MPITPSKLLAPIVPITPVTEGHEAIVSFLFDTALPGDATFAVSLQDWEANVAADTLGLYVRKDATSAWHLVAPDAPFVVTMGSTGFDVMTNAVQDSLTELTSEKLAVVARQTEFSAYVTDSWNVRGTVLISEDTTNGATTTSITANHASYNVNEGSDAVAGFTLASPLLLDAVVRVSIDSGSSSTADYGNFRFQTVTPVTGVLVTSPVPGTGLVTIPHGVTQFNLLAGITGDLITPEYNEAIVFVVAQTETSANLTNSWYIVSQANITDVVLRADGIAASAKITAVASSTDVFEGADATANFVLKVGNSLAPLASDAVVSVSLIAANVDGSEYSGFDYSFDGFTTSFPVLPTGLLTIPAGTTAFGLRTHVNTDLLSPELNESLIFAVSQMDGSTNLNNSYWVTSTATIRDVGVGVTTPSLIPELGATPATLTAAPTNATSFAEDVDAVAGFVLSHPLLAAATFNVSLQGWGAEATDYAGFKYRLIPASGPLGTLVDVPGDGNIVITPGALGFQLSTHFQPDAVHGEATDSVAFIAAQEIGSQNIDGSYWVAQTVNIVDVIGTASGVSI